MTKYLLVYRSEPFDPSQISPEEMQQSMARWMKWIEEGFQKGWMVDPGDALLPVGKVVSNKLVVTDGPFVESKEILGGYSVIQTSTIDEAVKIAKTCPNIAEGGNVELRQMAGLGAAK